MSDQFDVVILGCLPRDDEKNRAYAKLLGLTAHEWVWPPPHKGSVTAACEHCTGAIWLSPEQQSNRGELIQAGTHLLLLCLFDAAIQKVFLQNEARGIPGRRDR